jgi:hypothetical protein
MRRCSALGARVLGPINPPDIISAWKSMPTVQSHREVSAAPARQCFSQTVIIAILSVAKNGCKLASPAKGCGTWHTVYR